MGQMNKPTFAPLNGTGCLLVVVVLIPLIYSVFYFTLTRFVTGEPYFDNAWDRAKLRRIAEPFNPVIQALEDHKNYHGRYPDNLNEMDLNILSVENAYNIIKEQNRVIYYHVHDDHFWFYLKLSWDGGLKHESRYGHWRYDPGNGDPEWPIYRNETR